MDADKVRLKELRRRVRDIQEQFSELEPLLRWFDEHEGFQKSDFASSYCEVVESIFKLLQRDITDAVKGVERETVARMVVRVTYTETENPRVGGSSPPPGIS